MPESSSSTESSPRNRPPNYGSRSMQFRLLVLVGGLMLVLVMMDEARKPENWMWMGFNAEAPDEENQDTRVSPRLADLFGASDGDNSLFRALAQGGDAESGSDTLAVSDSLNGTLLQILRRCFSQLDDRQIQDLFIDLDALLSHRPLESESREQREQTASRIQRVVDFEVAEYRRLIQRGPQEQAEGIEENADQEQQWESLLSVVQERFEFLNALLVNKLGFDEMTIGQLQELTEIRDLLDQVALEQIEDNTLGPRAAEQHAWYRTFELMQLSEQSDQPRSAAAVTTFDLAEQPQRYRGRWVELKGHVREVKQVSLERNRKGFQDYWELWVRPDSGPDVPVCVYARSLPEGFPVSVSQGDRERLKEPVRITGCFFKNMSYRSVGGLRVSPLVLVTVPQWEPRIEDEADAQKLPSGLELAAIMAVCLLVAILFAWWVYRATRLRLPRRIESGGLMVGLVVSLAGAVSPPSIAMAQDDRLVDPARPPWLMSEKPDSDRADFHSVYQLFEDIEPSQLDRLGDFETLDSNEPVVQQILSRLEVVGRRWLEQRSQTLDATFAERIVLDPSSSRGDFVRCRGKVQSVSVIELSEATWNQFERDLLFKVELICELEAGSNQPITVYSNHVPASWEELSFPTDEAEVAGVFVKLEEQPATGTPHPVLLADRMGWFPVETPVEPWQKFWCDQGFDFARWEVARAQEGRPLQAEDGPCFYGLLRQTNEVNVEQVAEQVELERFDLFKVLRDPNKYRGTIVQFEGIVKRVTEISTGEDLYANDEGVARYFQLDMLLSLDGRRVRLGTKEKGATITGRYPITVCVKELPVGLEMGEELSQRVSVVAAFFRNWKYRSEYLRRVDEDLRQLSPMLIGLGVKTRGPDQSTMWLTQVAVGVLVVGIFLSGIGFLILRRSDMKYDRDRAKLKKAALPDQLDWPERPDA
ncbi:MAG: hypothetical protein MK136_04675 [Pirellulaceae bacterium]|nr:hypothetical protein [Pirellulaceae bacterium]